MYRISFLLFFAISVFAQTDKYHMEYKAIFHSENNHLYEKIDNTVLPCDTSNYSALYQDVNLAYELDKNFFILTGAKTNYILYEDYFTLEPYASSQLTEDELNTAIVSEASLNYDDGLFSLSLGKNSIGYDWLSGSMDGAIAMIYNDTSSLQFFWMNSYEQLYYNYYSHLDLLQDSKGLFGAIFHIQRENYDFNFYNYNFQNKHNIFGVNSTYIYENIGVKVAYTYLDNKDNELYSYNESLLDLSLHYLYKKHYFQLGASFTGENGLYSMLGMGSYIFGQFYLSNQVDRNNAQNSFFRYSYTDNSWIFNSIIGTSIYNDTLLVDEKLSSKELDLSTTYQINNSFSFNLGFIHMDADTKDPISANQTMIFTNLVFNYETI